MITTAPLPSWSMLAAGCSGGRGQPVAAWLRPGDEGLVAGRSAWSLAALARVAAERLGRAPRILFPAWICDQSLWPLRQTGARPVFLPVRADGGADWRRAEEVGPVDMAVLVHTFGHAAESASARAFAQSCGILLVEDCAHALRPGPGIGEAGDLAIYSPHKLLPLPDGAILVVRPGAAEWFGPLAEILAQSAAPAPIGRWLCRRLIQTLIPDGLRPLLPPSGQPDFTGDPETVPLAGPFRPSGYALGVLAAVDLEAEAEARRNNQKVMRDAMGGFTGWRPLFAEDGSVPYRLAMLCDTPEGAQARYAALRRARLPVESWPDLPPEVQADPAHAEGALALRRRVLLVPVHGGLDAARLARLYGEALS